VGLGNTKNEKKIDIKNPRAGNSSCTPNKDRFDTVEVKKLFS
jgi:hypothetical protein